MSRDGRTPYTMHWDVVRTPAARERTGEQRQLVAIWPAPVRHDRGFEAAGFTDFGAHDAGWERNTDMATARLIEALGRHGAPQLRSVPLKRKWSLFMRLFISPHDLPLPQQIGAPMHDDGVPECHVAFGEAGVSLRTRGGHAVWWVELPVSEDASALVQSVAGGLPVFRTALAWEHLL